MSEVAVQALGTKLRGEFTNNAALRRPYEERWAMDLRQYLGIYEPKVLKRIKKNRSKIYLRKTKTKVDALTARLIDLQFPAKGEKNWTLEPSTTPEVHPDLLREVVLMEEYRRAAKLEAELVRPLRPGEVPHLSERELRDLTLSLANDAAEKMSTEMEGQLAEGPGRASYRSICERMVFQGVLYGCGVLKGPLVERRKREKFMYSGEAGWILGQEEGEYWPFREFVSIWDIFPDMTALEPSGLRFVWQSHLKTLKDLKELEAWPGFDTAAISEHIKDHPDGDAELEEYESNLRGMSLEDYKASATGVPGRYRLLERWGYLSGKELADAGVEVADETGAYAANVWLLGERVVKAVLAPIEGIDIPYCFFMFGRDETGFFPEGVASVMRHPQSAFNTAVRMILDNAAACAGPQVAVNMSALHEGTDPDDHYPFKTWKFKNVEDMKTALNFFTVPSNVQDLLMVAKLMADWSDELTTPRFMGGDNAVGGAAETASGLSMLMGAANIVIKGLVAQFDISVTRPHITWSYYWNMRFNPREDIKGDFVIKAIGSSALIARELQAEQMLKAIQMTDSPRFHRYVKDRELLVEGLKLMDLNIPVRTEEEAQQYEQEQLAKEAQAQAMANVQALLGAADKQGVALPDAIMGMLNGEMQKLGLAA